MALVSDKFPRFPNKNFVKLQDQCGKKAYEVILELDDDGGLWIEVLSIQTDKMISPAEPVRQDESIEKATERVYKRLVKEGKIEPKNRPKQS